MEGYEANEETFRFEEIKKKGPTGSYLGRTLPIYRKEFYEPKFDIRDIHNNWIKNGEPVCEDLLTAEHEGFSYNKPRDVYFGGKKVN